MNLNVKLLQKIQAHILAEPKRLDMEYWFRDFNRVPIMEYERNCFLEVPKCKTIGCIAGWSSALAGKRIHDSERGALALGLPYDYGRDCMSARITKNASLVQRLFYIENWPARYRKSYNSAATSDARVKATVKRIDYFIKHRK